NAAGTAAVPNALSGVILAVTATNNRIGTNGDGVNDAAERNVISGNTQRGVLIQDVGTTGNVVAGNYIGTNTAGTLGLTSTVITLGGTITGGAFTLTVA